MYLPSRDLAPTLKTVPNYFFERSALLEKGNVIANVMQWSEAICLFLVPDNIGGTIQKIAAVVTSLAMTKTKKRHSQLDWESFDREFKI